MKKLLALLLSTLFLSISMIAADRGSNDHIEDKAEEVVVDKVLLDDDIKPVLMHAFFSRYRAAMAARASSQRRRDPITAPLSNVNREAFNRFSNDFELSLSELVNQCQKHRATVDVMGTPFICKDLEEFLVMTELKAHVLEVNDWSSFLFGGYSKEVKLSSQAAEKLSRLRRNITDSGSVRDELHMKRFQKKR
jgi:hypothetical protein